jgi:hypothetical protein
MKLCADWRGRDPALGDVCGRSSLSFSDRHLPPSPATMTLFSLIERETYGVFFGSILSKFSV